MLSSYGPGQHQTLSALVDEFFGRGDFQDALGGAEGREKIWKNKWRKHWPAKMNTQFGRTAAVVKGIRAYGEEQNLDELLLVLEDSLPYGRLPMVARVHGEMAMVHERFELFECG